MLSSARHAGAVEAAVRLAARGQNVDAGEAAQEFESMLIGEMMKNATKPMSEDGPLGSSPGARLYQELFLEEVVRQSGGRMGLARWIEPKLESEGEREEAPTADGDSR